LGMDGSMRCDGGCKVIKRGGLRRAPGADEQHRQTLTSSNQPPKSHSPDKPDVAFKVGADQEPRQCVGVPVERHRLGGECTAAVRRVRRRCSCSARSPLMVVCAVAHQRGWLQITVSRLVFLSFATTSLHSLARFWAWVGQRCGSIKIIRFPRAASFCQGYKACR